MDVNLVKLLDVIIEGWHKCLQPPYGDGAFSPEDGQTDCNKFVNYVCQKLGYKDFDGLRANSIYDKLIDSRDWLEIASENAIYYSNKGYLVIAAWKNPDPAKSGHVAIVRPGEGVTSQKWHYSEPKVPRVANVGPANACRMDRGSNWAFGEEPKYFVLKAVTSNGTKT